MKKKLISLLLAMTLTLSLAGCEKAASVSDSASAQEGNTSTETGASTSELEERGDDLSGAEADNYPVTALYNINIENSTVYLVKGEEYIGSFEAPKEAYPDNCFFYGDYLF